MPTAQLSGDGRAVRADLHGPRVEGHGGRYQDHRGEHPRCGLPSGNRSVDPNYPFALATALSFGQNPFFRSLSHFHVQVSPTMWPVSVSTCMRSPSGRFGSLGIHCMTPHTAVVDSALPPSRTT